MRDLVLKARVAAQSAKLLLETGDVDGAVNRAYYAMFDVARETLRKIDPALIETKKHATILGRFSQTMVKDRGLSAELAASLHEAFEARMIADYAEDSLDRAEANAIIEAMDTFLAALLPTSDEQDVSTP